MLSRAVVPNLGPAEPLAHRLNMECAVRLGTTALEVMRVTFHINTRSRSAEVRVSGKVCHSTHSRSRTFHAPAVQWGPD